VKVTPVTIYQTYDYYVLCFI